MPAPLGLASAFSSSSASSCARRTGAAGTSGETASPMPPHAAARDAHRDGVIAISVDDITPFLLKGGGIDVSSTTDAAYSKHLTPETESRVAILEVSGLTAGYVEIHYNAVDLTGGKM